MSQTLLSNNPAFVMLASGVVPAHGLDMAFAGSDTVNGNAFLSSGSDLLIIYNSDSVGHYIGILSAPDPDGRYANVSYVVNAGAYSFVKITTPSIFIQPITNLVLLTSDASEVEFLVIMGS